VRALQEGEAVDSTKTGLVPVVNEHTKTLIFGSFPGEISLAVQQYYGNPHNAFWKIMGDIIGEHLVGMPYEKRLERLLAHKIGLWDVYDACEREGSLDSAIRKGVHNDFTILEKLAPKLKLVCFNGKTAGEYASMLASMGYRTKVLPSTSPANRNSTYEEKLNEWKKAFS
jgi:double-stranded uracil-DNA glycosylase